MLTCMVLILTTFCMLSLLGCCKLCFLLVRLELLSDWLKSSRLIGLFNLGLTNVGLVLGTGGLLLIGPPGPSFGVSNVLRDLRAEFVLITYCVKGLGT